MSNVSRKEILKGEKAVLEQGRGGLCQEGGVPRAMLTLCPPEKSSAVRLGAQDMERTVPPKSELK